MQNPTVLITGAVTLLGHYLVNELYRDYRLVLTTHKTPYRDKILPQPTVLPLDVTDKATVSLTLTRIKPQIIVHLAALSNIDYCENHPQETVSVNVLGTKHLIQGLTGSRTHIIFMSSNAVFSGDRAPYHETDETNPLNEYGKTKQAAEEIVLSSGLPTTVVRATTMFGWPPAGARGNDVTYYLQQLKGRQPLYLVNNRFFNPIYALRASQIIAKIIRRETYGVYHIAGRNRISRYSFVKHIIHRL